MNREDILNMAREADPDFDSDPEDMPFCLLGMDAVERFADLVAAKAAQDEREACAESLESMKTRYPSGIPNDLERGYNAALRRAAAAIRARGQ